MSADYKIAVLGPIPRDHITTYEGKVVNKYGCVLYPVVAISTLMGDSGKVFPVTHVRKIDKQAITDILSPYKNVSLEYLDDESDQGDVISLKYVDQNIIEVIIGDMLFHPEDIDGLTHTRMMAPFATS